VPHPAPSAAVKSGQLAALAFGALGIVYGDIGTSPLYAFRESFEHADLEVTQANAYGVASVVFWSLVIIISIKYLALVMRADNHGEGGILALMTRMADNTPPLLVRHVEQIGALQESVVALTVKFADVPRIPRADRLEVRKLAESFWQITAHFGFVQVPDLPAALRQAKASGCEIELRHAIFFNARDAVVAKRTHNLAARARLLLFAFMLRNAVRAVDLFRIPTDNFIEMGRLVEI
jgi:K+ transporter